MAAATVAGGFGAGSGGSDGPRRRRSPFTFGRVLLAAAVLLALGLAWTFLGRVTVSDRPNEVKMTTVVVPPPPPPPPPPEPEKVEQPPEPTPAPPIDQPQDVPPPPDVAPSQSTDTAPGDSALTAREGAGPSNYGLQRGDGGGTRIGGRPGGSGDAFRAYGMLATRELQQAAQRDPEMSRGRYVIRVQVSVDADGRVTQVHVLEGGDERRNARIVQLLTGLQLSQRPPPNLPVMRIELSARGGA